jgi:hypothetical protein
MLWPLFAYMRVYSRLSPGCDTDGQDHEMDLPSLEWAGQSYGEQATNRHECSGLYSRSFASIRGYS